MNLERSDSQLYMDHVSSLSNDSIQTKAIYNGEIVTVDNDFAYVSIGTKTDGRVSLEEFEIAPKVGDIVEVMLVNRRLLDGMYVFSIKAAKKEKSWQQFLKAIEGSSIIQGIVTQKSKSGYIVDCDGFHAFLPLTLAADIKGKSQNGHSSVYFKVKNVDKRKRSVVLSRKDFLDEEQQKIWDNLEKNYSIGDVIRGKVTKFVDFGAFIDIGGIDALLHRNDISWRKVFKKKKILRIGEERDFVLLSFNRAEGKIALGLKQLFSDPWLSVPEKFKVGETTEGKVVTLTNFGMFIEFEAGVEGFCAATDISWTKRMVNPKDNYKKGDRVNVVILDVDLENRKLLVGIKQLYPNPWDTIQERFPLKSIHTRT
ncbi:MAG TPA: S1 RNA-binding domain-containing protein, partial [Spirochaetota bacterium]|nr:S1 RNA-binding domain-containing protein [Spirochaetota bacterium]